MDTNFEAKAMLTPLLVFALEEGPPMFHHAAAAKLELELHFLFSSFLLDAAPPLLCFLLWSLAGR